MRWVVFVLLQVMIVGLLFVVLGNHADKVIVLKKPPTSLAQWYKPDNKRQVWLHTMFKLRRQMLAIEIYAKSGDAESLQKWTTALAAEYRKIAKMVPEWQMRLDTVALAALERAAADNNLAGVTGGLKALGKSCESCHSDFRAVVATLYRAPDFTALKVAGIPFKDHMKSLTQQVNRIKIGFVDGKDAAALAAFTELSAGMTDLGKVCVSCHKKASAKPYPAPAMAQALNTLGQSLQGGTLKDKGQALGTLAVLACAQCHATHRLSGDTRALFATTKSMAELLDHSY